VRSTDEDQPGSRRPNLMSSPRRSGGEVNILATLDGLGTRPHARRALLRYGAGGLLACALLGSVAWMVRGPTPAPARSTVAVELPAPVVTRVGKPAEFAAAAAPATIVNLPAVAAVDAQPAPAGAPAEPSAGVSAPRHTGAHASALKTAPKAAPARAPAVRTGVAAVHPMPHAAAKRLAAARSAPAPAAVDTDVALITAIMQHAANQRPTPEDGNCPDKPCGPRTPPQP
jgi:hypothetical protein